MVLESEVCTGGSGEGWVDAKWEDQGTSRVFEAWLKTTMKDRNSCLSDSRPLMLRIATLRERETDTPCVEEKKKARESES